MNRPPPSSARAYSPSLDNLRNLLLIRSIALLGQAAVLAYVLLVNHTIQSLWGIAISLLVMGLLTTASLWRTTRPWPVADQEFLIQLMIDVLGWSALMYFTGGANNPFISYYIVPLVIAAAVLPWRHTWLVAGASLLAYSVLLYYYVPFAVFTPHSAMGHNDGASVHVLGMWFNFLFSVSLITYFVVRMAATLRRQEARETAQREDRLRNDQIMAVASLAAGTAHELGTPLSTMVLLTDELLLDDSLSEQARQDCTQLRRQIAQCKSTLAALSRTAELTSVGQTRRRAVGNFARQTLEQWQVRRPGVLGDIDCAGPGPELELDPTMSQALENLLNNAADSGSQRVHVSVEWDAREARIGVRDWGCGIAPQRLEHLGKPVIHASRKGLGIGLMLTQAAVERCGGRITLHNMQGGGVLATLILPLHRTAAAGTAS
ncbi:MAG: HAMP domain-containing histidine kinase [Halioglobus sp.]|nr:HAMP domain-containing histidine kinase [Halioglobus sp.]